MDKYSRKIVGWSLSIKRDVNSTLTAFRRATTKQLLQSGLYFHSDRDSEYVALKYQKWLKKKGVIQSMNRKDVMNDNAEEELRAMIVEYIGFYNQKRIHSSLDYLSPNEYEVAIG